MKSLIKKIKQKGLVSKSDIAGFINNADLDIKKKKSSNTSNRSRIKSRTRQNNKALKHSIQVMLVVKIILKMIILKISYFFSQCTNIF